MPSASQQQYSLSARDVNQANNLNRLHNSYTASQNSLQKTQGPPQYFYSINNSPSMMQMQMPQNQQKQNNTLVSANNLLTKSSTSSMQATNSMLSTPDTLSNYMQMPPVPLLPQHESLINQSAILMPHLTNQQHKTPQQHNNNFPPPPAMMQQQYHNLQSQPMHQYQHHQHSHSHQQQYNQQQPNDKNGQETQVPMTTIMIPANAAAQLQNASQQIQQATMQAMIKQNQVPQPQILVLMIPYMTSPTPQNQLQHSNSVSSNTPEQQKLSTLNRQSYAISVNSNISMPNSRTMSSLSVAKQEQEKFYIKTNFSYNSKNKNEISFKKRDILHVTDTFAGIEDELKSWFATRICADGQIEKGLIPNQTKADKIIQAQQMIEQSSEHKSTSNLSENGSSNVLSASVGKVNFLKRRAARRSKSFSKDNWDNVVFEIGSYKLPAYERVIFKHPGFRRPVVIFGPLADIAREKLLKDYPERYSYPAGFNKNQMVNHPKVIRLKNIQDIIDQEKYALLDITPSAVEKLNYVNLCPIVIFMKAEKSIVKEFRQRAIKSLNESEEACQRFCVESSRKLMEQACKLEKLWSHLFTATLNLSSMGSEMWYRKLRETIDNQQALNVWMGERKSDKKMSNLASTMSDVLFPLTDVGHDGRLAHSSFVDDTGLSNEESDDSISKSTMNLNLVPRNEEPETYGAFYDRFNNGQKDIYGGKPLVYESFHNNNHRYPKNGYKYCESAYYE